MIENQSTLKPCPDEITFILSFLAYTYHGLFWSKNNGVYLYGFMECTDVTIIIHDHTATNNEWTLIPLSGYNDTLTGVIDDSFTSFDVCLQAGCFRLDPLEAWTNDWDSAFYQVLIDPITIAQGLLTPSEPGYFAIGTDCDFTEPIYGCTDPNATNYNPEATQNDGSCTYTVGCEIVVFNVVPDSTGQDIIWIIPGDSILFATEVLWNFGDSTTSTELFPQHEYSGNGPYYLCLTVSFESPIDSSICTVMYCHWVSGDMVGGSGFASSNDGFKINVINGQAHVGISEAEKWNGIKLWPNPATDQLNISYNASSNATQTISIMDITGKTLLQESFTSGGVDYTKTIDVSSLPTGVYLMRRGAESYVDVKRFVISK